MRKVVALEKVRADFLLEKKEAESKITCCGRCFGRIKKCMKYLIFLIILMPFLGKTFRRYGYLEKYDDYMQSGAMNNNTDVNGNG